MTYEILITRKAEDDLKKFDRVVKKRIKKGLLKLSSNPQFLGKRLVGSKEHRFRIGSYRIIYEFFGRKIIILRVGHRREIYK